MFFLGWLLSLGMAYFFFSTLPLLAGTWMVGVSIVMLLLIGTIALAITFMLFTARFD